MEKSKRKTTMKSGESKLHKHKKCDTLYLSIPAHMVQDSAFPFKADEKVALRISDLKDEDTDCLCLIVTKTMMRKKEMRK